jgi:ATP dependent DNA ligase domain
VLCAFDLIEIDGKDLRRAPIEERKQVLTDLVGWERDGIVLNVHYECDGATVFKHACALGCEGIVSKRRGSPYRSGRVEHWLKIKNEELFGMIVVCRNRDLIIERNMLTSCVLTIVFAINVAALPVIAWHKFMLSWNVQRRNAASSSNKGWWPSDTERQQQRPIAQSDRKPEAHYDITRLATVT